jgi:nicotinate phosphoribosyltransferase
VGSTALLTDRYELTMLDAALRDGTAERDTVFEVFTRRLPAGRRFGVVAGLGRLLEAIEAFRFDDDTLAWLDQQRIVGTATLEWLAGYRFRGDIEGYREGEIHVAGSPVLTVRGTFADAVLLETLTLSILNHDSAVAAAAARMVAVSGGRDLFEFGSRRAHEAAAVAAARAAYVVGFVGTSNLEAGRRHGIPTLGTSAHAYTLLHDDEQAAFASQLEALGVHTTLLVDTFDTSEGLRRALAVAGTELGGVRIDSGDLAARAREARELLDAGGADRTRIVLSGDLDEHRLHGLRDAPADAFGVGTSVVTGAGAPTAGFVYKLVERSHRSRAAVPTRREGRGRQGDRRGPEACVATVRHRRRRRRGGAAALGRPDAGGRGPSAAGRHRPRRRGRPPPRPRRHPRPPPAGVAELPAAAFDLSEGGPVLPTLHEHPVDA